MTAIVVANRNLDLWEQCHVSPDRQRFLGRKKSLIEVAADIFLVSFISFYLEAKIFIKLKQIYSTIDSPDAV